MLDLLGVFGSYLAKSMPRRCLYVFPEPMDQIFILILDSLLFEDSENSHLFIYSI